MQLTPKNCTNFKSRQLARLLTRHYDAELAKAGLKGTQFSLLTHVQRFGPITPGILAKRMGLDASTLTRNLQPLLRAGWLVQDVGLNARNRFISMTPAGFEKQAEADLHWLIAQESVKTLLGHERATALVALIDECLERMQSGNADNS